ncbi:MAG: hypothetical protein HXY30_09290 [Pseudorhodoplanes sp.]|jgi:hypothetical protein|nr:hypothetical protein [Pseudorhodoplanes sp.]
MTKIAAIAFAALTVATFATPSFASGTAEQRAACTSDAFKFCMSAIPNISRVESCMKQNYSKLSPGCQAQFK